MIREPIIREPIIRESMLQQQMHGNQLKPKTTNANHQEPTATNIKMKNNGLMLFRERGAQKFEFHLGHIVRTCGNHTNIGFTYKVVGNQHPHNRFGIRQTLHLHLENFYRTLTDELFRANSLQSSINSNHPFDRQSGGNEQPHNRLGIRQTVHWHLENLYRTLTNKLFR